jgi:hypothetical protein
MKALSFWSTRKPHSRLHCLSQRLVVQIGLVLCIAYQAGAQTVNAMVSGTISGTGSGATILYTVPSGSVLVLTDFTYTLRAVGFSEGPLILREGLSDKWTWRLYLDGPGGGQGVFESEHWNTGLVFAADQQVTLIASVGLNSPWTASWSGYLVSGTLVGQTESHGPGELRLTLSPNPMAGVIRMRFALQSATDGTVAMFNSEGRRVRTLYEGVLSSGEKEFTWDGRDDSGRQVAQGIYLALLRAGVVTDVQKIEVVR